MKKEDISEAMGNLRAEYIEAAATFQKKVTFKWRNAVAIAACICLIAGAGAYALPKLIGNPPVKSLGSNSVAGHWELTATSGKNKTEVVYTVTGGSNEDASYIKYVNNTDGEVYGNSNGSNDSQAVVSDGSDSSEVVVPEQPVTEDSLSSDFSAMVETAPAPEVNYTLIPAYRFLYEQDLTNTNKPSYWNPVFYIYGNHFIDAGVGDYMPVGVYVSDDGKSCYVIDKKSEGTSTKTTYSILGDDYKDFKVISVETLP